MAHYKENNFPSLKFSSQIIRKPIIDLTVVPIIDLTDVPIIDLTE